MRTNCGVIALDQRPRASAPRSSRSSRRPGSIITGTVENAAVQVCLMIEGQEGVTWEQWVELARAAEAANLDALFRPDHSRAIVRGEPAGALGAWATLAGLAAVTERLRLGTLVSPITFRRVPVLAKLVTTVDHISGGRVELGLGAGWFEAEHDAYGFRFPALPERLDELDRQLADVVRQWTEAPEI